MFSLRWWNLGKGEFTLAQQLRVESIMVWDERGGCHSSCDGRSEKQLVLLHLEWGSRDEYIVLSSSYLILLFISPVWPYGMSNLHTFRSILMVYLPSSIKLEKYLKYLLRYVSPWWFQIQSSLWWRSAITTCLIHSGSYSGCILHIVTWSVLRTCSICSADISWALVICVPSMSLLLCCTMSTL